MLKIWCKDKDKLKLERLYEKYSIYMHYEANKILNDKFLAEDAVQRSFIRLYDNLDKIDENNCRKTKKYLVNICKNVSIDIYNERKNRGEDELDLEITSETDSVEDIVINNDNIERLYDLIRKLPLIYQQATILRFVEGYSIEEIAEMSDTNTKTVQKRIERGKKQLLILLSKVGELNE